MTRIIEGLFGEKTSRESESKGPVEGFDVNKIAEVLDGWELTQPDPESEKGSINLKEQLWMGDIFALHYILTRIGYTLPKHGVEILNMT